MGRAGWIAPLLVLFALMAGCNIGSNSGSVAQRINESNALSLVAMVRSAQALASMDQDRFVPTLAELDRSYGGNEKLAKLVASPQHIQHGYVFVEINQSESGSALDSAARFGLAVYPVQPGVTGSRAFLLLMDWDKAISKDNDSRVDTANFAQLWTAPADKTGSPLSRWPSETELRQSFQRIDKNATEALKEARKLKKDYDQSRQ